MLRNYLFIFQVNNLLHTWQIFRCQGFNKHTILPEMCKPSDHAPISVKISIDEVFTDTAKLGIKANSQEEMDYISFIIHHIASIQANNLTHCKLIEDTVNFIKDTFEETSDLQKQWPH